MSRLTDKQQAERRQLRAAKRKEEYAKLTLEERLVRALEKGGPGTREVQRLEQQIAARKEGKRPRKKSS